MSKSRLQNVEKILKHLFDGGEWNPYESNILNLAVGAPGTDLLENCCDIFEKATKHRMQFERQSNSSMLFQYGPTSGTFEMRAQIAKYFTKMYDNEVKSENIVVTAGASQGLHFVLSTLVDFNGYVFVDYVTYMIAIDAIKQFTTLKIIPVKLNDDGIDLAEFESLLKEKQFKSNTKEFWGMYYAIPTFHNPTGILFADNICRGLIELARKYDILITCDDVYNILHYTQTEPPKRLFAYDEATDLDYRGNVISNGSFSKIIGPGVRLGWLEVPPRLKNLLEKSGVHLSGGCFNNYTAGILASLFELDLVQPHIDKTFAAYKERMLATCAILESDLPKCCSMIKPLGGYFIWIRLPEGEDASEFLKFCLAEEKIYFIAGPRFSIEGKAQNCLRIAIAFHTKEILVDGAKRFCSALRKYLKVEA